MNQFTFEEIASHLKQTGFLFQGSEIYGGLANTWDFGPLGIELKDNVKAAWWKTFIQADPNNVGLQSAILMNPQVWQASGHLATFSDPLMDCRQCKARHRADKLIEEFDSSINASALSTKDMENYIKEHNIACPTCGSHDFTSIRQFNLMFKTFQGVTEDSTNTIYLRPETAQGMFVNFKNIYRTYRKKIPFGIGQIGKSFRNEITPGNLIFRTREFEQMELEFFCKPGTDLEWYEYYKNLCMDFIVNLGVSRENLRFRDHDEDELSHYSVATVDIEYRFPWGWDEVWGIADRTDFDLKQHQIHSKTSMEVLDQETNEKYIPYTIEPSVGVERLMLVFLCEAYRKETLENDERIVLKLDPRLVANKAAILPLSKKLSDQADAIYRDLINSFSCDYDAAGSIGKRYRRQDAMGTPFCITVDFDSETDQSVTIRHRDSMEQERVKISELKQYIQSYL